jgi:hydroxyacylglutathione hydrolase
MRLARVGVEKIAGQLEGGITAWKSAGLPLAKMNQMTVQDLDRELKSANLQVLDVRRDGEWQAGHIDNATHWALDNFKVSPPELDGRSAIAVHCKSGYRSIIAASLLQRAGFANVINVLGGFDAWQKASLPAVTDKPVEV